MKVFVFGVLLAAGIVLSGLPIHPAYAVAGENKRVFFVHHSTGQIYWDGTVKKGGMEAYLAKHGYTGQAPWWDGETYAENFYTLFNDANSWVTFGDADIIIFKSCFPASAISSDDMLAQYKDYYTQLYSFFESHPDMLFVPMSTPPLPKDMTNADEANRAIAFDEWLATDYVSSYSGSNLAVFRLHRLLDNASGYLKTKYVADPTDGHPRARAGVDVGKAIWKRLNRALGI